MGKSADNEIRKSKAAYMTNLATALVVAGFFAAVLALYRGDISSFLFAPLQVFTAIASLGAAFVFRVAAREELEKIQD